MLRVMKNRLNVAAVNTVLQRSFSSKLSLPQTMDIELSEQEFDEKYINYFNRPDIDHWEIRSAMNKLAGMELVPEPAIICAALRACRRLNDYALTVRFMESLKNQAADHVKEIYPYILQEIKPTLDELGISTIEELGYDKPELACELVDDIH